MTLIRKATEEDLKQLTDLFDCYRIFYDKESDKEKVVLFLTERLNLEDSKIFVSEIDGGKLVGFVQLYPLFSSTRMKKLWLLNDLFVDVQHRGNGISKKLIQVAKELCVETNACGLTLETSKLNDVGNSLYPKTGFILDNENNYYFWNN